METRDCIKRMNQISTEKLAILEELAQLTRRQNEAITLGRFEELEDLIRGKQSRINAIDRLDENFVAFSAKLKSALSLGSLENLPDYHIPGTRELKELVGRIHQKLLEIKALDEENSALLKDELKKTGDKINHSNTFKRAAKAYYPVKKDIPSYYFDKKK